MKRLLFVLILALLVPGCAHYKVAVNPEGLHGPYVEKAYHHASILQKHLDNSGLIGGHYAQLWKNFQHDQRLYEQRLLIAQEQDLMREQNMLLRKQLAERQKEPPTTSNRKGGDNLAAEFKETKLRAESGNATAQNLLGIMYSLGRGVPKNYAQGMKWHHKAAEQGLADAQNLLGLMYAGGLGAPKDYVNAYMWLSLAADQGDEKAQKTRDDLAKKMTSEQIAESQKLASKWKPVTPKTSKQGD